MQFIHNSQLKFCTKAQKRDPGLYQVALLYGVVRSAFCLSHLVVCDIGPRYNGGSLAI